ncbi:hypothetical protein [Capnocytophaga sp.]|uniref:hypothetical protein n=1 Tax=Capnocytophaga sp. TaxID=44737 RepID=UPI0026DB2369|nr:hypothetical protein [Capnocytophaga sp.]MDO5106155.1 hypothetical protein [Capnocytophaga sp.]
MNKTIFDIYELPDGHQQRFSQKLRRAKNKKRNKRIFYLVTAVAASLALLLTISSFNGDSLEKASPTAYQSEQYYLPLIQQNIQAIRDLENQDIAQDALTQLEKMNQNYQELRREIIKNGQNQHLLAAMIVNFDTQIKFSNDVITASL